jgi:hypothetical protein
MKAILLVVVIGISATSLSAQQSLKDLLYSGKLKSDTGSTVRKTDDLKSKIDTTTRKKPVEEVKKPEPTMAEVLAMAGGDTVGNTVADGANVNDPVAAVAAVKLTGDPTKDNNARMKAFMDEFIGVIRTEVLTSKKVKDGTYAVLLEYEINVDGTVSVVTVSADPKSDYLEDEIRKRLTLSAPQLSPVLTNGRPRKVLKKQVLSFSK